tara:strand:+ start:4671 stop:4829 length:159 start_codon:yes stop_codon:yes gene_type:complete
MVLASPLLNDLLWVDAVLLYLRLPVKASESLTGLLDSKQPLDVPQGWKLWKM